MNKTVANNKSHGTMFSKPSAETFVNPQAPIMPPNRLMPSIFGISLLRANISDLKANAPLKYPGHEAKVFVALAIMGGMPANTRTGKIIKLPPPASEFIAPPKIPAANKINMSMKTPRLTFIIADNETYFLIIY